MSIELLIEKWRTEYARGAGPMHFANRCADELEAYMNTPAPQVEIQLPELLELLRECLPAISAWKREDERRYTDADGVFHLIVGPNHYKAMALADRLQAALNARAGGDGWLPIESAPEGAAVLLAIEYASGRQRVIRAMRAGEKTLHLSDEQDPWDGCLYDESEDCYYCAPGWYEKNEFDECNWAVSDTPVMWQPLPSPPAALASQAVGVKDGR